MTLPKDLQIYCRKRILKRVIRGCKIDCVNPISNWGIIRGQLDLLWGVGWDAGNRPRYEHFWINAKGAYSTCRNYLV